MLQSEDPEKLTAVSLYILMKIPLKGAPYIFEILGGASLTRNTVVILFLQRFFLLFFLRFAQFVFNFTFANNLHVIIWANDTEEYYLTVTLNLQ